jgi:hypothetical protein
MVAMIDTVLSELETHGLLLKTDTKLPSVAALVAGEPVRGSWWAHPMSHQIFHVLNEVADHPDVLTAKLVSGKDTFIHRSIWPAFLTVAMSREPWQVKGLDKTALALLEHVDEKGEVETKGDAARALEKSLLVHGEQEHTESGSHAKVLKSWAKWMKAAGVASPKLTPAAARESLEKLVAHLNGRYGGAGTLPWRKR